MSEQIVNLGQPPAADAKRDAVHIAVIPQVAKKTLQPGDTLVHGVVDPFRKGGITKGESYWLILTPGTAANLRHQWDSPHFPEETLEDDSTIKQLGEKISSLESELDDWGCRGC